MLQVYSASCTAKTLAAFEMPADTVKNHLIIQAHNYDPQGFTATDATWTKMTDTWGSASDKKNFDDLFKRLGEFSVKQGAPLVVGEYGANYKGNESSRKAYAEYFVTAAAKYGIKCFWWDTGDMALFDRSAATVKYPDIVSAITSPFAASGKDSGNKDSASGQSGSSQNSGGNTGKNSGSTSAKSEKLAAPVVSGSKSGNKVKLKWSSVEGAERYRLYRYNAATKKYVLVKTLTGTSCSLKITKAGTYRFILCAAKKTDSGYKNGNYSKVIKVTIVN